MFGVKRILDWLGITKASPIITLRPHRTVDLPIIYDEAFARVIKEIELTLGANIYEQNSEAGQIEAGFGLVNNERVRCTFDRNDGGTTTVHIEAQYRAGTAPKERSAAVEALANALESGIAL